MYVKKINVVENSKGIL